MKEIAWIIMFLMPTPHQENERLVIYTFPTEQECVESIPDVKRKHRLFFQELGCKSMKS